ncbi:NifX-associated nitrogen fixation protein [Sulfurimonas marina]|uniref:NifX-associated nitrogen fixation protein n=1 Tax=Sulfurimonas marina TaxID=2590551 RepID=A0A7M1ATJ0_9BACT|nr:NifX-associated nitrogen fixation protein [Sulfurimonas marina]QOP40710.1 NifX-associated nitrogen fixation protein [Sulfurimonas marina]
MENIFIDTLIGQVRALDQFGTWANREDEEILKEKYVKSKEELKNIPVIADIDEMQIQDIRLIYQSVALAFEKETGVMCSVVMEMSHEGFGRAVVIADKIVIVNKFFKDAHRFSFRTYEKLVEEGEKMVQDAIKIYNEYKK